MYERRHHKPLSTRRFVQRMVGHAVAALGVVVGSLLLGMAGYRYFEGLPWLDAFLNAAMLLGGMGPVNRPMTGGGKLFAGLYALYSGLVFVALAGLLAAPFVHRMLHKFQWESDGDAR